MTLEAITTPASTLIPDFSVQIVFGAQPTTSVMMSDPLSTHVRTTAARRALVSPPVVALKRAVSPDNAIVSQRSASMACALVIRIAIASMGGRAPPAPLLCATAAATMEPVRALLTLARAPAAGRERNAISLCV